MVIISSFGIYSLLSFFILFTLFNSTFICSHSYIFFSSINYSLSGLFFYSCYYYNSFNIILYYFNNGDYYFCCFFFSTYSSDIFCNILNNSISFYYTDYLSFSNNILNSSVPFIFPILLSYIAHYTIIYIQYTISYIMIK